MWDRFLRDYIRCGLWTKSAQLNCLSQNFIGTQLCSINYILFMTALSLPWQSLIVVKQIVPRAKP